MGEGSEGTHWFRIIDDKLFQSDSQNVRQNVYRRQDSTKIRDACNGTGFMVEGLSEPSGQPAKITILPNHSDVTLGEYEKLARILDQHRKFRESLETWIQSGKATSVKRTGRRLGRKPSYD